MTQPVYAISICAQAILNLHSLNNEGSEGNQTQTRMVDIIYKDDSGLPRQANVNAISGDMIKHIQIDHLHKIALEENLPLCEACKKLDANRMSADSDFRAWIGDAKPTQVQILDRLISDCVIDALGGNLITEGGNSTPRKSVFEVGWVVGLPEVTVTEQYLHAKFVPDKREKPDDKDAREGNLGQMIFHRPASSGVYAFVINFETSRIGYNDISQTYVEGIDRKQRYDALLESALYTLMAMKGAMRSTQMPHLVAISGAVALSYGKAPAPTISPLNKNFEDELEQTAAALNAMHGKDLIAVKRFDSLPELTEIIAGLQKETQPFELRIPAAEA
jgi:CRISPR-associated protein Cst2